MWQQPKQGEHQLNILCTDEYDLEKADVVGAELLHLILGGRTNLLL